MGKKVRSARGVMVDFDLMQIKKQIAANPAPVEVKARQNFIENRLKRRIKKAQTITEVDKEVVAPEMPEPAATIDESHIEDDAKEEVVSEALAAVEETVVEENSEIDKEAAPVKKTRRTRKKSTKTTETKDEAE